MAYLLICLLYLQDGTEKKRKLLMENDDLYTWKFNDIRTYLIEMNRASFKQNCT